MKIGIPKALLYYRYEQLWKTFFGQLGCEIVVSDDTSKETIALGAKSAVDENCLPLKVFLGHVASLQERCDAVLVPRIARTKGNEEYCIRFWGLPDLVQNTFREAPMLSYNVDSQYRDMERKAFVQMGRTLGKSAIQSLRAYQAAKKMQKQFDQQQAAAQQKKLQSHKPKILIVSQPYLMHDSYIGGVIAKMITEQGGIPLFSDCCDREKCWTLSKKFSDSLYWRMNREMIGAIALYKDQVDGIILLTAFPCGADSLVSEMVMRKVKDVPMIQLLMDEHQAQGGLETRMESFLDILQQRRK